MITEARDDYNNRIRCRVPLCNWPLSIRIDTIEPVRSKTELAYNKIPEFEPFCKSCIYIKLKDEYVRGGCKSHTSLNLFLYDVEK